MDIVLLLKRSAGMSVNEMAGALRLSYMGIKQHCTLLEKKGYLDHWQRPKAGGGRPEKMYRLTAKLNVLFPNPDCDCVLDLLEAATLTGGPELALRLLAAHYEKQRLRYMPRVKGRTLLEKAQSLAKARQLEGYVSSCEFSAHDGLCVVEYHSSVSRLAEVLPQAAELEAGMISQLLGCEVERVAKQTDKLIRHEFRLKAPHPKSA
jgi:predicted ArsR family transcriptional regulator